MPTISANGSTALSAGPKQRTEIWVGITKITFGPNNVYFHGGEMPGYNSFMGYDPVNDVTLIIWTSLTISLDGKTTANTIMQKMLDQIYTVSPLQ
jgi:D-alanyl-D-alanine carboxypeptidase